MNERMKIVFLVLGALLTLVGIAALGSVVALQAVSAHRDADGYTMLAPTRYSTSTSALLSEDLVGGPWTTRADRSPSIRVRVRNERSGPIFVGVAASRDVEAYLRDVPHDVVVWSRGDRIVRYERHEGARSAPAPAHALPWVGSVSGAGTLTLTWQMQPGRWSLVVMNADGAPYLDVSLQPAFRVATLAALIAPLAVVGTFALIVGLALVLYGGALPLQAPPSETPAIAAIVVRAHLDEPLSRWLWLVKWFLAIPHVLIVAFLGMAFVVLTVAAFFAILFTGRYPERFFVTNVGILRWGWRVAFYGYSGLATDQYPPFTLRDADYPASLSVAYPTQLSRGLALVKWWLLAIPHYLIIAIFGGFSLAGNRYATGNASTPSPAGLLSLLVLFAGVALLFTGRYPRGIFDLVIGLHRWIYRVITYVALMHDVYPPFRVDLGGEEPLVSARAIVAAQS
jgi:hypothetical protein